MGDCLLCFNGASKYPLPSSSIFKKVSVSTNSVATGSLGLVFTSESIDSGLLGAESVC